MSNMCGLVIRVNCTPLQTQTQLLNKSAYLHLYTPFPSAWYCIYIHIYIYNACFLTRCFRVGLARYPLDLFDVIGFPFTLCDLFSKQFLHALRNIVRASPILYVIGTTLAT